MRTYLLIAFSFFFSTSFALHLTKTPDRELSEVDRLYYTCKIWGLMKYYHPLVAKGSYNWDEKLQNLIRLTSGRNTTESFSEFYARYIYNLGQVPPCRTCTKISIDANFNLAWTQDSNFSPPLRASLKQLGENPYQGAGFYVSYADAGQFEPRNEGPNPYFSLKEKYQRILPLFRVWNYVEYFYPHKYMLDQDWDEVLREMIPVFLAADTKLKLHLALVELVVKMDDCHSGLVSNTLDQFPYYTFLPARFEWIEQQVVITEILDQEKAVAANLQVGDIIRSINGRPAAEVHESNKKYIWGSNEAAKNRSLYATLFMGIKGSPAVEILRGNSTISISPTLYKFNDFDYKKSNEGPKWELIGDSIGYVDMSKLAVADVAPMMEDFTNQAFIFLDLRNGSRGTFKTLATYFNDSDTTFAKIKVPDPDYPGKFKWSTERNCGQKNPNPYQGQVVLLVNSKTQNSDEFGCMCLQTAPRVTTIGSQTAGAVGNVSKFAIIERLYSSMTGVGIHYPDGTPVQRLGITVGLEAKRTVEGILSGEDEVLDRAIQFARLEIQRLEELQTQMDSLQSEVVKIDTARRDSVPDY